MPTPNKFIEQASDLKIVDRISDLINFKKDIGAEKPWKFADATFKLMPDERVSNFARDFTSRKVSLGRDGWQSDNSDLTPWQKVQIALTILSEQNPRATFKAGRKEFHAKDLFQEKVYNHSLNTEGFRFKLRRFVFNMGKYGIGCGTTRRLTINRPKRSLVEVSKSGEEKYDETTVKKYDGPWFKPLSPYRCVWDDGAEVFDMLNMRDWAYYDFFTLDQVKLFSPSVDISKLSPSADAKNEDGTDIKRKDIFKVWFYESQLDDLFVAVIGDTVIDAYPLGNGLKELSFVYAPWMLRDDKRLDGVGIPEILSQDKNMLDKIRNMRIDQVVLSIYKSFFYDGTNQEDDVLIIAPGKGQQTLDPSKLRFLEVPAAGPEAYKSEQMIRDNMDALTFPPALEGGVKVGRTAYEVNQAVTAAMRRLSSPLDSLKFALRHEARLRMSVLEDVVTTVDVDAYIGKDLQDAALAVYKNYPDIFHWSEDKKTLYRYKYPEMRLGLKAAADGTFKKSEEENFFLLTPESQRYVGDVEISVELSAADNLELERAQMTELSNLLVPLFAGAPEVNKKPAMQLLRMYKQDPSDWLPDAWLSPTPQMAVPAADSPDGRSRSMPSVVAPSSFGRAAKTVVGKLGRFFSKVNPKSMT